MATLKRQAWQKAYDKARAMLPHRVAERRAYAATPAGKKSIAQSRRKWRASRPDMSGARNAVAYALKTGKLTRPEGCWHCGAICKPEAHHAAYDLRLDVTWLCRPCHMQVHA